MTEVLEDRQEENEAMLLSRMAAEAAARTNVTGQAVHHLVCEHCQISGKACANVPAKHLSNHQGTRDAFAYAPRYYEFGTARSLPGTLKTLPWLVYFQLLRIEVGSTDTEQLAVGKTHHDERGS